MEYFVVDAIVPASYENLRYFFHPAEFDNFKDEKFPDFKTVSVSQRKKLAGLKTGGPVGL